MEKSIITASSAPQAIGPYSQAVITQGERLLFVSGQIGLDPQTMEIVSGGTVFEAKQVMKNIGAILEAAGGNFESVVKATIYLADISDFADVNDIYASYFEKEPPARAAIAVAALPKNARLMIEAIAVL